MGLGLPHSPDPDTPKTRPGLHRVIHVVGGSCSTLLPAPAAVEVWLQLSDVLTVSSRGSYCPPPPNPHRAQISWYLDNVCSGDLSWSLRNRLMCVCGFESHFQLCFFITSFSTSLSSGCFFHLASLISFCDNGEADVKFLTFPR